MPCNTIQTNRVDVAKMHPELLKATAGDLLAAGWRIAFQDASVTIWRKANASVTYRVGSTELEARGLSAGQLAEFRNLLARKYSKQAIFMAAKKNGWKVRQVAEDQFEVQR